jgi:hypothetical protein
VLRLTYTASNGATLDLAKLGGEFAGWYAMNSSNSWRHRYSREPVIDTSTFSKLLRHSLKRNPIRALQSRQ